MKYEEISKIKEATDAAGAHNLVFTTRLYYNRARKNSLTDEDIEKARFKQECALEKSTKFLMSQEVAKRAMKKLFFVSCICLFFMFCELVGGIISGSLAILVDAAHMFSDVAGFMISYCAIYISQKKQTFNKSYGYHRAEVLGAILSVFVIWGLLIWLNIEAVNRIITPPPDIDADVMLITSIIGLLCNITNFCALNCACGTEVEQPDDEPFQESEQDDWTIDEKNELPHHKHHLALT